MLRVIKKAVRGLAMFLVGFVVGDTPEIALSVLCIVAVMTVMHELRLSTIEAIAVPFSVMMALGVSVWRTVRKGK
jgi:ABC-type transport system involved in Fe-S cluster assembly fused permease/ATPase subunit